MIVVDSNELATNPGVVKRLRAIWPDLIVSNLEFGDLQVILPNGEILLIERKTVHDFLGSIGDGRLFRQAEGMAQKSRYYAIICEGKIGFNKDDMVIANGKVTNWRGPSIRGAIFAINWSACPFIIVPNGMYEVVVQEIIEFVKKPEEHWQKNHRRIVTFPPVELEVDILAAFPNIGLKRATALLEFVGENGGKGSLIEALAWGSAMMLLSPKSRPVGWGKKIVGEFRKALGLKKDQYIDIRKEKDASS